MQSPVVPRKESEMNSRQHSALITRKMYRDYDFCRVV
jgi:hypothetical protein